MVGCVFLGCIFSARLTLSHGESCCSEYSEERHKECLQRMYYQHEIQGVCFRYSIEYEHGLYGEMPWSCPVRCRHYDGYGAYYERHHGTREREARSEAEAEEREVIVQEITRPDSERVEDVKGFVADIAQGEHTVNDTTCRRLHLIIYGKLLPHET